MKKSITKNYLYNLVYQVLILLFPLITAPYVSRVLGAENIGIYSYTLSISAFFILFGSLGIAMYGKREIAYEQDKKETYSKTFWEITIMRSITMIISMIIFYLNFINKSNSYQLYYKILMLEMVGNTIDISWFFQGLEEFKKISIRNCIIKVLSVCSIFLFVKSKDDLFIYFFIYTLSILLGNISLWFYLPKFLAKVKIKELKIFRHLKPNFELFIPQIAIEVYTLLDKTMIGAIINNKAEVGYYEQSQKIIKMLLAVITSLGTVMLPRIANTFAKGNKKEVLNYMEKSFRVVFFLAFPMIFGIIAVSNAFVPIFFGEGYSKVATIMKIISPIILFIGISNVTGTQFLLPTKRQKEYTASVMGGAIINFILNSLLIWNFKSIGAAIGTVFAELVVTGIQMYFTRKDFNFNKIAKSSKNYLICSIVMFFICMMISLAVANNLYEIVIQVGVGILVYIGGLILLKDQVIIEMKNKTCAKIRKVK